MGLTFWSVVNARLAGNCERLLLATPLDSCACLPIFWEDIPERFRDDIMDGVATYLAHRYGNLQINGTWVPVEEPDAPLLAGQILEELERHPLALATPTLRSQSTGSLRQRHTRCTKRLSG